MDCHRQAFEWLETNMEWLGVESIDDLKCMLEAVVMR